MGIPTIFRWPTPWFWVGLTLLVAGVVGDISLLMTVGLVILAASLVHMARGRGRALESGKPQGVPGSGQPPGLDQRLSEVERRLTDTQDVMIALSEKIDRWERDGAPAARDRTPAS